MLDENEVDYLVQKITNHKRTPPERKTTPTKSKFLTGDGNQYSEYTNDDTTKKHKIKRDTI